MANSNGTKRRKFNETHPWLKFSVDLQRAPFAVWMDLGAIQSKCEHVAHTLLPPEVARGLYTMYLAKGAWATTAIDSPG